MRALTMTASWLGLGLGLGRRSGSLTIASGAVRRPKYGQTLTSQASLRAACETVWDRLGSSTRRTFTWFG